MQIGEAESRPRWLLPVALLAGAFGIATVVSGGRVLFGPEAARVAAGRYVPFVVWFNFVAGFAYVAAAAGIARSRRWAGILSACIAGATLLVLLAFGAHALAGGAFEGRTVAAMTLRAGIWTAIAVAVRRRRAAMHPEAGAAPHARGEDPAAPEHDRH